MKKIYRIENGKRVEVVARPKKLAKMLSRGWQYVEEPKKRGRPPKEVTTDGME